jgi:glycosyltransferase involved in cell wall biosynthesis
MRVAAYTGGPNVPSARARIRQYIGPLSALGVSVQEYPLPWGNALPKNCCLRPLWAAATAVSRAGTIACSWKAEVTWVSRQFLPAFAPIHVLAKRPVILDVDDAIWLNTGGHRARELARASELVVCGNSFLASQFSQWNPRVTVIPTAVDTSLFRPVVPDKADHPDSVLGWIGTSGNFPFLYAIEGALKRVMEDRRDLRLLVVADKQPQFRQVPESRVEFQRWSPSVESESIGRMTIGLMPLADDAWCQGKCSYKMLCYMASGLPVVVSAAGMNSEVLAMGEAGFGARSEREWVDSLTMLLEDANLRRRMGAVGRAVIEERFSLPRLTERYAAVFRAVAGVVESRIPTTLLEL